ncbi:MAG TPA: hypothetical protein DEA08_32325, partial [Planctomycetes bacterium]|nr:hypothetical protein [Planctomycetota bacterium]
RQLVIWVGVLGASLATAEGRHISIEAVPKLLGDAGKRRLDALVSAAALSVTGIMFALSLIYLLKVQLPKSDVHLFIVDALDLKVPRWPFLVVVPAGLGLMCLRFGLRIAEALTLSDEAYAKLHAEDEDEDVEVAPLEADPPPPSEEAAQPEPAPAESAGTADNLSSSSESAARRAFDSDAWPSDPSSGPTPIVEDVDDLSGESEEEAAPLPRKSKPRKTPSLLSTDEIPIYQDLADDEDLREPEIRRGLSRLDSSEELESVAGLEEDLADPLSTTGAEAEEALEAMARSTDRISPPTESEESAALDEVSAALERSTDRYAPAQTPDEELSDLSEPPALNRGGTERLPQPAESAPQDAGPEGATTEEDLDPTQDGNS